MSRGLARKFAEEAISRQKEAFQRWGVLADWTNCYYTFNKELVTKELEVFFRMYENVSDTTDRFTRI